MSPSRSPILSRCSPHSAGGSLFEAGEGAFDASRQFADTFSLRDSEQLLLKFSYRFVL